MHSRGFADEVSEYENLGARFLLDDEAACAHIVSGTAFGIGFEGQYSVLPPELVWVPVGPALYVPMNICFREAGGPAVRNFVTCALDVALRESWLRDDSARVPGRLIERADPGPAGRRGAGPATSARVSV